MSTLFVRPVKSAVSGFLGLFLAAVAVALANRTGILEAVTQNAGSVRSSAPWPSSSAISCRSCGCSPATR